MIPKSITINGVTYTIRYGNVFKEAGKHVEAVEDYSQCVIVLDTKIKKTCKQYQDKVLMHEIAHAILDEMFCYSASKDEAFVEQLGVAILQVCKQLKRYI